MKKITIIACVGLLASFTTGCAAGFTSITQDDSSYILTKDQAGAFSTHGEMWRCKPMGNATQMQCRELAQD